MWLTFIPVLLQFLAALPGLIQTAEKAFSGAPGNGPAKKELVTGIVDQGLSAYQQVVTNKLADVEVQAIKSSVDSVIDSTVSVLNSAKMILAKDEPTVKVESKVKK